MVSLSELNGNSSLVLHDEQTGAEARIAPGLGFNCYSFQAVIDGKRSELLWSHPEFLSGAQKPSRSGIPILFPFAGRIRGTAFRFDGREYHVPVGDDFGNAIHGFVLTRPWRVLEHRGGRAAGQFQASDDAPELLVHWPADFKITVAYELTGNRLAMKVEIENSGDQPLPFWLGTHPYFRVPLVADGDPAQCRVFVPADRQWQLADMLPTGAVVPVPPHADLRTGRQFTDLRVDDILTGLRFEQGQCVARIEDRSAGLTLRVEFGQEFPECVVFVPPHREAICIEPYTSVSNAFELEAAGVKTGLRVLRPGERFGASLAIALARAQ